MFRRKRMKHSLQETILINKYLEIYGNFLTKTQFEVMSDYFQNNLSLSEISELRNISRSAISDTINNSIKKLESIENKLHLCEIFASVKKEGKKEKEIIDIIIERIKDGI